MIADTITIKANSTIKVLVRWYKWKYCYGINLPVELNDDDANLADAKTLIFKKTLNILADVFALCVIWFLNSVHICIGAMVRNLLLLACLMLCTI